MSEQDKSSTSEPPINVGVYGCTKAGKTQFLFQLLDGWQRQDRLLPQSEQVLKFLDRVRAEIRKHGASMPTAAPIEDIRVSVRSDGDEPTRQFVFRDLCGEFLMKEIPPGREIDRHGIIANQVKQCDAFLFFFDPGSSENPADIDQHRERELQRAKKFIEYVLGRRENRYLPILFVLTHLDLWQADAKIKQQAEAWRHDVNRALRESYRSMLKEHFPPGLIDVKRTSILLSSVGDADVSSAARQLAALVSDADEFRRKDSLATRSLLSRAALALAAVALFVVGLFLIAKPSTTGEINPPSIGEMSEKETLNELGQLERIVKTLPHGSQLPSIDQAKPINHHLRRLSRRMGPASGTAADLSAETRQRMRSALNSVGTVLLEAAENDGLPLVDRTALLAAYLDDLPDFTDLADDVASAQSLYWRLLRSNIVAEVADILQRRESVASPPLDTLTEVLSKLRGVERDVSRSKVFGSRERQELAQEARSAATFCEDRKKSRSYSAVLRVVSANDTSHKQADLAFRNLKILSPNHKDEPSANGIALIPNNDSIPIDVEAVVHWGPKCWDGYENSVKLSVGGVTRWDVKARSKPNTDSKLGARQINYRRSDALAFAAQLEVTDGTFVVSSREHGQGGLSVKAGDLLDGRQTIALDRFDNRVVLTATRADGGQPNEFHTKEPRYPIELGLGSPVVCVLSRYDDTQAKWRNLQEFDLTTEPGPLAPLGLPLLRPDKPEVKKHLAGTQMDLDLEFSGFSPVPRLLINAATRAKDQEP